MWKDSCLPSSFRKTSGIHSTTIHPNNVEFFSQNIYITERYHKCSYYVSQLVSALSFVNLASCISLYPWLNTKICVNWNLSPILECRNAMNISLTLFFSPYCKYGLYHSDSWSLCLARNLSGKKKVCNLQYGPQTWLVSEIHCYEKLWEGYFLIFINITML